MNYDILFRGAIKPLLSVWRLMISGLIMLALFGCVTENRPRPSEATGYITDQGVVRIWRKDDSRKVPLVVVAISDLFDGSKETLTYNYSEGKLTQILRIIETDSQISEQIRFDTKGNLTFMQRQSVDSNSSLRAEDIAKLLYVAKEFLRLSDVLTAENIKLIQGYIVNKKVITCDNRSVKLSISNQQQQWLEQRIHPTTTNSVAWLSSPSGDQLLLAQQQDLCQSAPQLDE